MNATQFKSFVNIACKNKVGNLLDDICNKEALQRIASLAKIDWKETDSKELLCLNISLEFEKTELVNVCSKCQMSFEEIVEKGIRIKNKSISQDVSQMKDWLERKLYEAEHIANTTKIEPTDEVNDAIRKLRKLNDFKKLLELNCNKKMFDIHKKMEEYKPEPRVFSWGSWGSSRSSQSKSST